MGAGRRAAACDVFSYHEEVHGGFERPEVERITKEEKDARQKRKNQTVKYIWSGLLFLAVSGILTLIARISLSFSEWYSTYIYKRPGVCDRAVVWESFHFRLWS